MSTLRISDAPLLPDVEGTEKIPTGGRGDYAISVDQIKDHIFQDIGKELVGLGNVDNTSDLDKPVSTAQQAALNLKADKTYVDTNLDLKADKTNVYTRSETTLALSTKADLVNGVVPENQIPSSFNDVLEFTTPNLPIVGESGKIYVTTDTNKTWRWATNRYVEVSGWNPDSVSKSVTLPTYYTKEAGVDLVTGVADGSFFNVRSSNDETYIDEYQNVGGGAVATGKSYPSSAAKWDASLVTDGDKNQHQINNDLRLTTRSLRDFGANPSKSDNSAEIQAAFNWSAETGCKVVGTAGDVYLINQRNFPLENNIFKFAGDIDFDGQFCTFKLSDEFGDYQAFGYRDSGDFRFKNVIIDENTTNNPLTRPQSDAQNFRTSLFLWGTKNNNTCEIDNIIFKDWCGIWQITTNNFSRGHVRGCKLFSSQASVTWIDRTSMYIAIHGAEISGNKFYGMGNNIATTPMESHASGQVIKDNYAIGYRNSLYLVNDPVDTLSATYEDVVVRDNKFINTAKGICIWNTFTGRNVKNLKILDNTIKLNSHLSTNAFSYPVQFGIGSLYGGWLGTRLDDVDIIGNEIEFVLNAEDAENDSTVCHGIQLNCYGTNAYYGRNNRIKGNTIKGAFRHGIFMDFVSGNIADSYLQHLEIKDNTIIDCAVLLSGAWPIRLVNVKNPKVIKIADNTAIDTRSSPRMLNVASISLTSGKGHIVSKGNELKYLNSTNSAVFNYNQDAGVYQEADRITIKPYNQESPTHFAAEGSTVFDTVANVTWHQVGAGVDNKWIIKVSSDDRILNTYVTAGSEAKPLNPNSLISNWVATRNGYAFKPWAATTAYSLGEHVNSNGQTFRCTQAGTSGTVAIGFSASEITDGTCKWVMIPGLAALWTPHYKKSKQVTIADSTATDVAGLNAVINSLLAQLRD